MRLNALLALILLCASSAWAADKVNLNVKLGLWEVTTTSTMSGMPPIPADALAKLSPEQRAQFEQSMKGTMSGTPKTSTRKSCETKEKFDKQTMFNDKDKSCTHTILTSTSTTLETRMHCSMEGTTSDGTMRIDAITPENVKGAVDMNTAGSGQNMKMKMNFTARWLGADCGSVK